MSRCFRSCLRFSIVSALIILPFSFTANSALSATTTKTIEGTKPYLSEPHITDIKAGNDFSLLGVKFDNNSYFTVSDMSTKLSGVNVGSLTPTALGQKLGSGTGTMAAAYNILKAVTDADDADGDGFTSTSLTGTATVDWYYMKGKVETKLEVANLSKTFCLLATQGIAPYIKIEGPVSLSTEYGSPRSEIYDKGNTDSPIYNGKNPVRRFYPSGAVCYASPNLTYASGKYDPNEPTKFNSSYGFLPQISAVNNFPSTGSNKLYFYLIVTGIDAGSSSTTWTVTSSDPSENKITATVSKSVAPGTTGFVAYNANTMVLVTLSGPKASSTASGAKADLFTNPTQIVLKGKDSLGNVVIDYGFVLKQWFINRGSTTGSASAQTTWCEDLNGNGYKIVKVQDLTNASGTAAGNGGTIPIAVPQRPASPDNYYQRRIGGGLFSEWGSVGSYTDSDWVDSVYWTSDTISPFQFRVDSSGGYVYSRNAGYGYYGACVSQ